MAYSKAGIDMFDIFVGPDKSRLRFHKNVLCDKAPYFAELIRNGSSGSKEIKIATFENDEPAIIGGPFY